MANSQIIQAAIDTLPDDWAYTPVVGKAPKTPNWQHCPFTKTDVIREVEKTRWTGVGTLCGVPSGGLAFLDHDGESCDPLVEQLSGQSLDDALPRTVSFTSGKIGRYQAVYRIPEEFWSAIATVKTGTGVSGPDGKQEQLEFRWNGCQSVVCGIHPDTKQPYHWVNSPVDTIIAIAPMWLIEHMLTIAEPAPKSSPKPSEPLYLGMDEILLIKCIAPKHRDLINSGAGEGGRDNGGIALAMDLIGTEQHLRSIGQRFNGDARSLFEDYCNRCTPPLAGNDGERIWKSAEKSTNGPCLSEDKIQGCIDAHFTRGQSKGDRASSSAGSDSSPFILLDGGKLEAIDETEYQAELEAFRESESTLKSLSEARFSDMGEEFFLGTGKIYEVCGGSILPNIRNGWLAASLVIGQILASLCPRSARIIPPDQRTSPQGPQGFVNIEGAPSAGKTVIFESIVAIMTGLSRVEYSRSLVLKEVRKELQTMEDSDEGLPPGLVVNPSLSKVHPSIRIGDFTLPALKTAIAAAGYWPYIAKQFTRCQLRSAGTLIFNREAVSMFESFSQNNQSEQGLKAAIAGFWAGEQEPTIRKTDSELIIPEDSVIGMVTACQSGQMRKIIETEIQKKAGAINTGFGLRFVSVDLENTAKAAKSEFIERDYSKFIGDPVDLHPLMEQFAAVVSALDKSFSVIFTDEATAFYRDIWFEWLNDQNFTGWFDGYKSKAQANLIRLAWAYRCMAIFDDIANGVTNIELKIGQPDVARAFEVIQRSTAKLVHEVALIEKKQDLDEKSKESEKQQSLVKSKYYVLFTDPSLTHQWVVDKRSTGTSTFRLLLQKINGARRAELKKRGIDVAVILKPVWDELETGPIAVAEPPAPIQPDKSSVEINDWTAGNVQDVRASVLNNPESAEEMRAHVPKELWSQVGISA